MTGTEPATATTTAAPPPPPRELTPLVRRRSWGEAGVRAWWLCAIVLGVLAAYVAANRTVHGLADRRLVTTGTRVTARVTEVMNNPRITRPAARESSVPVKLAFPDPRPGRAGETVEVSGELPPLPGASVGPGTMLDIRVDPRDPAHWTERTEAPGWLAELHVAGGMLLGALALVAIAAWQRRRVLATWRDAPAGEAVVVASRQSGLAPWSRILRLAWTDGRDKRVFTALARGPAAAATTGDTIWAIAPHSGSGRALVAAAYAELKS